MVAENRSFSAYTQADYDCQRCGRPETDAMRKRVRNYIRPLCDECREAVRHEGHGPGSGLICYSSSTKTKISENGRRVEETTAHKPIPIEESPSRCLVCFPR